MLPSDSAPPTSLPLPFNSTEPEPTEPTDWLFPQLDGTKPTELTRAEAADPGLLLRADSITQDPTKTDRVGRSRAPATLTTKPDACIHTDRHSHTQERR